jgi:pimeloyl-ACP methyl ester carboxylesterase
MRVRTAELRGLRTAWLDNERASAPIALFLHGYLDTPETWRAQFEEFGQEYRVVAPFARGVGGSEPPSDKRRYGAYSILLDHLEILRRVDPEARLPVHVVGHDVGGVHAWLLASHPSPAVRSVSVLNSAHPRQYLRRLPWPGQMLKGWYVGLFQFPWLARAALRLFQWRVLTLLEAEGWGRAGRLSPKEFDEAALHSLEQYRRFVRDIPWFIRERAMPASVPVLALSTEEDRFLERPSAYEFGGIADSVTVRIVRGRHWIHREQPERVNRILADFWRSAS